MPKAGGLPDVTQRIDLDASGYTRGSDEMVIAAIKMAQENKETLKTVRDLWDTIQILNKSLLDSGDDFSKYVQANRQVLDVQKELNKAFGDSGDLVRIHAEQVNMLADKYANMGEEAKNVTASQDAVARSFLESMAAGEAHGTLLDSLASRLGVLGQANREYEAQMDSQIEKLVTLRTEIVKTGDAVAKGSIFAAPFQAGASGAAGTGPDASYYTGPDYGAIAIASARKATEDAKTALAGVIAAQAAGIAGAQSLMAGRGGKGPGAVDAAIAAAMGGGGGWAGLAKSMAADSSGDSGTNAATAWRPVGAFLGTWLPRAHYVLMAANELAATLGPAVIAGGMGALVGVQGGEQAVPRLQAIFDTGESLGGSLGQTQGQYMGLKTPALQNAQDLATGAAFEGIGAVTNMLKAGAGNSFIQLGSNTVSMWSRMMAHLTTEFQGGLGKQLGGIVSGGTGYLSQFGQIFGNLGHTFLNAAPNLPGLGGDYLSILQGGTKGLSALTGWLGPALGPVLAAEAGGRVGTPFVGGIASLLGKVGGGVAGLGDTLGAGAAGGLTAADAAAIAGETGIGLSVGGGGILSRLLGRGGVGIAKAGGFLGALGAPEIATTAAMAFMLTKGATYQDPYQQNANALTSQINQMGIPAAVPSIISAMQGFSKVPYDTTSNKGFGNAVSSDLSNLFKTGSATFKPQGGGWGFHPGGLATGVEAGIGGFFHEIFGGTTGPTNYEVAQQKLQGLSEALVNTFGSGAQVSDQWKKLSGQSIDMGKAFDVATMAQLQLGSAFEKNGKLTPTAKTMIANLYAGYAPMNMNTGQFGSAVAGQTAMSGLEHTQVAAVNTAYDQLTQLVSAGPSGAGALSGLIAAMPKGSGGAMKGFLSPQASAAWSAFASTTQPSVISQLQSQTDYLREAQTMGALSSGQSKSMTEFLLGQALPSAKGSPSALAMLSMIGQQAGGPAFAPGTSAAQMYKQMEAFAKQGGGAGVFTAGMTQSTEKMANIGRDAQQFVQQIGSGIGGALATGIAAHGATLQDTFMNAIGGKGQGAALGKYTQFLAGSGVPQKGAQDMISYAAKLGGASPAQINQMMSQVKKDYDIYIKTHADTTGADKARAALAAVKDKDAKASVNVTGASQLQALNSEIATLKSKTVQADAKVLGASAVAALNAYIASLQSKTVTITTRMITIGGMPGVTQGIPAGIRAAGMSIGGMVPGFGSGDHVPALLEPGEAIVPKYLVPLIAPILKSHHVPGFAAGGIMGTAPYVPYATYEKFLPQYNAYKAQIKAEHKWYDSFDQWYAATQGAVKEGTIAATKATTSISAKATADANKIATEINYARSVSNASVSGLNIAGMSVDSPGSTGMGAVPPGHPGYNAAAWNAATTYAASNATPLPSVQDQMQSYLSSVKAFSGDLGVLGKKGLNKGILQQLIGAGPVQGDALAQSILGGAGGVGGVNKLFQQIQAASRHLGGTAAGAVYGGHPTTSGGSFSGAVNISINVGGGGGSGGAQLTTAQIKQITEKVQAALLEQAKRNRQTGVKLPGTYGA